MIGVYKSESLKPVIDADHMPFHQIIRKLGLGESYESLANVQLPSWNHAHFSGRRTNEVRVVAAVALL